jgi:hypothetical protein
VYTCLDVGDRRQRFLRIGVLRGEREQRRDAQGDPGRNRFRFDPERNPRHDDDQTRGDVRVEQVVAQPPLQREVHLQACEVTCEITP